MTCDQRYLAVVLLCLCNSFIGLSSAGFSGLLYGITNTAATIPGMIAPLITGALTPGRTPEEWRKLFFLCSASAVLGAILSGVLADGESQTRAVAVAAETGVQDVKRKREDRSSRQESSMGSNPSPGNLTSSSSAEKTNSPAIEFWKENRQ